MSNLLKFYYREQALVFLTSAYLLLTLTLPVLSWVATRGLQGGRIISVIEGLDPPTQSTNLTQQLRK